MSSFEDSDEIQMSVVGLGDPYFVVSLRAAGVEGRVVADAKEAEDVVELLVVEGKCKVIIVPQGLASELDRKRDELSRRGVVYPVFAVVPGMVGRLEKRENRLYRLVSQAVGAKLKMGES